MTHLHPLLRRLRTRRGGAVIEFVLIFPFLLTLLGGVADAGLYIWARGRLANAVAYGAQYAQLIGTGTGANTNITSAVTKMAQSSMTSTAVTVSVTGPACYCLTSSNPPTVAVATNCTTNCANGLKPGYFVNIQASYTYTPLLGTLASYVGTTMYENITMRVQ